MLSTLRAQKLVGLRSNSPAGLEFLTKAGARRLASTVREYARKVGGLVDPVWFDNQGWELE